MATLRQVDRNQDWRVVTIQEVNTTTGHIEARDQYDTPMLLDLTNKPTLLTIPVKGEMWTVRRRGSDWLLEYKYDGPDVSSPVSSLKPGDARLEASGTVYITSSKERTDDLYGTSQYGTSIYSGPGIKLQGSTEIEGNLEIDGNLLVHGNTPSPTGPAGGDLTGIYPNPTLRVIEGSKLNWHISLTPPNSPTDGMLWIYNGTAPYWTFIYDSAESIYNWKLLGGTATWNEVSTFETRAAGGAGAIVDLASLGPSITIPRAGIWDVEWGFATGNAATSTQAIVPIYDVTNAAVWSWNALGTPSVAGSYYSHQSRQMGAVAANTILRMRYGSNNSAVDFGNRWMRATPVKVS
jgi:hypothetical protein